MTAIRPFLESVVDGFQRAFGPTIGVAWLFVNILLAIATVGYVVDGLSRARHAFALTYTYDPNTSDPAWVDLPAVDTDQ